YAALKILGGKLPGKIGRCQHKKDHPKGWSFLCCYQLAWKVIGFVLRGPENGVLYIKEKGLSKVGGFTKSH
ncbi:hypothetical protein, partial [Bittarella massiliensis (ex Durand et al. 2017)]|uniref:hypothetical protein n=1 Tax=Bittarella massiliensis (ex Durand et al. 2017) TaxID=1720313 RepID=UPI001AA16CEB